MMSNNLLHIIQRYYAYELPATTRLHGVSVVLTLYNVQYSYTMIMTYTMAITH